MRWIRLAVLLIPLTLVAATCVTATRQRGPSGPWVVEVTNTGDDPAYGVLARATIEDASGHQYPLGGDFTCPSMLAPHATGVAEIFFPEDIAPPPVPPLRATEFGSMPVFGPSQGVQLDARATDRNDAQRFVLAEVRNDSQTSAHRAQICAVLRAPDGQALEVGHAELFPTVLRPGESQVVPVYFNTMPQGSIELFASGLDSYGDELTFDPSQVNVETQRVTGSADHRHLQGVASLKNTAGQDITNVRVMATIAGVPQTRVEAQIACGYGAIGRDGTAPVTMSMPVPASIADPELDVIGIEAYPSGVTRVELPVTDVTFDSFPFLEGTRAVEVTATVRNNTPSWVLRPYGCATLRDASGSVVGSVAMTVSADPSGMPPGESAQMRGIGVALAPVARADVSAPTERTLPPIQGPSLPGY